MSFITVLSADKQRVINNYLLSNGQAALNYASDETQRVLCYLDSKTVHRGELRVACAHERNVRVAYYVSLETMPVNAWVRVLCLDLQHEPLYFSEVMGAAVFRA